VLYSTRVSSLWSLTRKEEGAVHLRVMDTQMDTWRIQTTLHSLPSVDN
jgi:hypothetical protein